MSLVCSLSGLSEGQARALSKAGWTVTRLATLQGAPREVFEAVVWRTQEMEEGFLIDMEMLVDLVARAGARAENRHLHDAKRAQELLDAHIEHQRRTRRKAFDELIEADTTARVEMVGTAKRARWPTPLGKKLHIAGTDLAL